MKKFLNVKESMVFLGVSVHRVRKLLWERKLDSQKVDGRTMITIESLTKYKKVRDNRMVKSPTYHTSNKLEEVVNESSQLEVQES
jgi:hypothetical protein